MKTQTAFENNILENISLLGITENQFELMGESGKIKPGSNKENEGGELHYLNFEYRQVLIIENMPMRSLALLTLLAHKFVNDLEDRHNLDETEIEWSDHTIGESLDIEITFGVREPVNLVPVDNSPINFAGKMWGFPDGEALNA